MAILLAAVAANAQARPGNTMKATPSSPAAKILSKENLDRVKRHILASGKRCTYTSMYNNNPCMETPGFRLYLNPDPGPNGHPQWNINCDTGRGDFNSLVVQEKRGASAFHRVEFSDTDAIAIRGEVNISEPLLNKAVVELLHAIESEISNPKGSEK